MPHGQVLFSDGTLITLTLDNTAANIPGVDDGHRTAIVSSGSCCKRPSSSMAPSQPISVSTTVWRMGARPITDVVRVRWQGRPAFFWRAFLSMEKHPLGGIRASSPADAEPLSRGPTEQAQWPAGQRGRRDSPRDSETAVQWPAGACAAGSESASRLWSHLRTVAAHGPAPHAGNNRNAGKWSVFMCSHIPKSGATEATVTLRHSDHECRRSVLNLRL